MCGFSCLWKIDDEPLARRMIEKISHRAPSRLQGSRPRPSMDALLPHEAQSNLPVPERGGSSGVSWSSCQCRIAEGMVGVEVAVDDASDLARDNLRYPRGPGTAP